MSITTYAELKTAVASYLQRGDLTTVIPDFIRLAEAKLNRVLRLRAMEAIDTGTVSSPLALPTGFLEMIALTTTVGGSTRTLTYVTPNEINTQTGTAVNYSLVGDDLYFIPTGGGESYTLTYYAGFDALSDSTTTNWLLTNAPDAYLYASLLEAAPYLKDQAKMPMWGSLLESTLSGLRLADKRDRFGSSLVVRVA